MTNGISAQQKMPRILLVDGDVSCIYMVTKMWKREGYEVITAADGEDGLAKALAAKPDMIVLDVMIPKLNGWTLIKKLKNLPELATIPVILLTALNSDKEKILGFRLGADDYLAKPFHFDELKFRINSALKRRALRNQKLTPDVTPRILVVDDDPACILMVSTLLKQHKYEVIEACDGEDGMQKAQSHKPDLIILDVMMPKMDGWTLIKQLRSLPEFAMVPVIFLSSLASVKEKISGFKLGADDYLPKPFHLEELASRVNNALKCRNDIKENLMQKISQADSKTQGGISGTLDQIGLPSFLLLLEMEEKNGLLTIACSQSDEKAIILLNKGKIVYARIVSPKELKNEEAIYYALTWLDGKFDFRTNRNNTLGMEMEMSSTITPLLIEAARRTDIKNMAE